MQVRSILWFRGHDLRLRDQLALRAAARAEQLIPVFFLSPGEFGPAAVAGRPHHLQFLLDSLADLDSSLRARGSRLVLLAGEPRAGLAQLARRWRVGSVHALHSPDPAGLALEQELRATLAATLELHEGSTLHAPGTLRSGAGTPYAVFTPFARAFAERVPIGTPLPAPRRLPPLPDGFDAAATVPLPTAASLGLRRSPQVLAGGEQAARERLRRFLERVDGYATDRDRMDLEGTSRISADLKFGTLSPRQVWAAVADRPGTARSAAAFHNELVWREFNASTLFDRPALRHEPFRAQWADFPWRDDEGAWQAWASGRTGYPVVDAAARQLLATGFVHNRARMVAASFLTRQLLLDYTRGEAHYLAQLTDGDPAQNLAGWQWSAGCGTDAQPWFRIFNPVIQGRKFDPAGDYVRRWVPELAQLDARWIHRPWAAPVAALKAAGIRLGHEYPEPLIDHQVARERFLERARRHLDRGA